MNQIFISSLLKPKIPTFNIIYAFFAEISQKNSIFSCRNSNNKTIIADEVSPEFQLTPNLSMFSTLRTRSRKIARCMNSPVNSNIYTDIDKARRHGLAEFVQSSPERFDHNALFKMLQRMTLDYRLKDRYTCLVFFNFLEQFFKILDVMNSIFGFVDLMAIPSTKNPSHARHPFLTIQSLLCGG